MARWRVVMTDFTEPGHEIESEVFERAGLDVDLVPADESRERGLAATTAGAHALLVQFARVDRALIESLTDCRVISRYGIGVDMIDLAAAAAAGIPVANVPDYGTEEVADSAIGLTLALTRGITYLNSLLRADRGPWSYTEVAPLHRLRGRVFAVVGLGRIGTAAALRARALGMEVAFHDPYKPDGYDKALGIRRADTLDELLGQAFVLSLHCPRTPETVHLIDAAALARMPRGSFLVNTARGAVVDTAAIPEAIRTGQLAGAAIDVLATEPPPPDDPLIRAWRDPGHPAHHRLIVNPHAAFYSEEGLLDMRLKGAKACRNALLGLPLLNVVN